MLGITFLKTEKKTDRTDRVKITKPDLNEILSRAREAMATRLPMKAISILTPYLKLDDIPPVVMLAAGKALGELGRYPEALDMIESYLSKNPSSIEGLISAGLISARACEFSRAINYFRRASNALNIKARLLLEPLGSLENPDPVAIEDLVATVESNPGDTDKILALACALGSAGHFRAVERFVDCLKV